MIHQTRKTLDRNTSLRAKLLAERADKKRAKALAGLKGKKVGGHLVMRGGDMDVQLGDELSESWRQLEVRFLLPPPSFIRANSSDVAPFFLSIAPTLYQPEGNLFRDRFASLQHRALVEPRKPQTGKRKLNKHKSYEKHRSSPLSFLSFSPFFVSPSPRERRRLTPPLPCFPPTAWKKFE